MPLRTEALKGSPELENIWEQTLEQTRCLCRVGSLSSEHLTGTIFHFQRLELMWPQSCRGAASHQKDKSGPVCFLLPFVSKVSERAAFNQLQPFRRFMESFQQGLGHVMSLHLLFKQFLNLKTVCCWSWWDFRLLSEAALSTSKCGLR